MEDVAIETGHAPSLQIENGEIVITGAAAGSLVKDYNMQGQLVKTQTAVSNTEILHTATFPRGVYIVTVNDLKKIVIKK
jgi:hypothetical protein